MDGEDDTEKVVILWDSQGSKVKKNMKLRTIAKYSIKSDFTIMITRATRSSQGKAYQLGPMGSAYSTLKRQGAIKEHEPTVEI